MSLSNIVLIADVLRPAQTTFEINSNSDTSRISRAPLRLESDRSSEHRELGQRFAAAQPVVWDRSKIESIFSKFGSQSHGRQNR
jgi:hypothetical protein